MQNKIFLNWEDVNFTWDNLKYTNSGIDMTWDEVYILIEIGNVIRRGGGGVPSKEEIEEYIKGNPWDVTKRKIEESVGVESTKKFIKLLCRVNELDYEKVVESNSSVKVTVEQIEKVFNEGVKVAVKI
jgi:hypothetical protein